MNLSLRSLLIPLVLFAIFFAALAWVQFATPDLPDNDGYYHIRFAELMRREGLKPAFPWLPLTVLNPREFYDHHFLFHAGLVPFTFGDLRLGAKWAAVFNAALAFLAVWLLLRGQHISWAWLWALGLLAVSQAFLYRMSITRAQSLSLAVLALGLHWMLTGRYRWLLPLGFFYVWLYNAFPLLPALALVFAGGSWLSGNRLELRPLGWSLLGVGLGLLVNPYFPQDIFFAVRHFLPKLTDPTAIRVGSEWYPYNTGQLLENSPLALAAFMGGALALGLHPGRWDRRTATAFLLAALFGLMLFQARRFIEYFPPFALIFAAFAWQPLLDAWAAAARRDAPLPAWLEQLDRPRLNSLARHLRPALPALLLLLLLIPGVYRSLEDARAAMRTSKPHNLYAAASAWLQANTPAGERVFQTDWDDFPRLFYYNTHNTYLIGLDPTYLQLYDPDRYVLWEKITRGEVDEISAAVPSRFGARYILTDLLHDDFLDRATADPGLKEVYRDDQAAIFEVVMPR